MDDFMNIERNPIVKILAQESDIDYVNDAVAFLFVVSVLRGVKGQYVSCYTYTLAWFKIININNNYFFILFR